MCALNLVLYSLGLFLVRGLMELRSIGKLIRKLQVPTHLRDLVLG
jgi:hypothetical protein